MSLVPMPDPGAIVMLAWMGAKRDRKGNGWCSERGVGAARDAIASENMHSDCLEVLTHSPRAGQLREKMREARAMLALECALCGGCSRAGE